jgi:hypothetical protein
VCHYHSESLSVSVVLHSLSDCYQIERTFLFIFGNFLIITYSNLGAVSNDSKCHYISLQKVQISSLYDTSRVI